jgi:hypothetical protein
MGNVLDKSCREIEGAHFMFNNFFSENRLAYEIILKNVVKTEGPHMTSQYGAYALHGGTARLHALISMHTPTRAGTNMHARTHKSVSNTCNFSTAKMIRESVSMLHYTDIGCLALFFKDSLSVGTKHSSAGGPR